MELEIPFIHNKVVIANIHITGTKENPLFSAENVFEVTGFDWYRNGVKNIRDFNESEMIITLDDPTGEEQTVAEKLKFLSCYQYGIVHLTELGMFKLISRSSHIIPFALAHCCCAHRALVPLEAHLISAGLNDVPVTLYGADVISPKGLMELVKFPILSNKVLLDEDN